MIIGKITTIEYDRFRARLLHSVKSASTSIEGRVYHIGNIGSYVKIQNHVNDDIICEVIAIQEAERDTKTKVDAKFDLDSVRELILRPVGILTHSGEKGTFSLGVSIYPSIYSDVHVVTRKDLNRILAGTNLVHREIGSITLGTSKSLIDYPVSVEVDKFFNIHTAVLGNSGSGKSYTIAHILQSVLRKPSPGAKFILFDTNGEYPEAFQAATGRYNCVHYKPNTEGVHGGDIAGMEYRPFILPYYLLNLEEWLAFLMASDRTQRPFWAQVLQECYKFHSIFSTPREMDEDPSSSFANYIKWRVYQMLQIVANRVDTDTAKMTSALGVISQIENLMQETNTSLSEHIRIDLERFLSKCRELCGVHYGDNRQVLTNALSQFCLSIEESSETTFNGSFTKINEQDALRVSERRMEYGEFFQDKFLKAAAEMVLLQEEAKGNSRIREFTSTMFSRLDFFLTNRECTFMREIQGIPQSADEYWAEFFGDTDEPRNQLITIDLSELGDEILELVTSVISRMIFDRRRGLRGEERRKKPIHLVLDEAHRYIKRGKDYILRENIFERIAREGRKFAYYLLVSSQRPSELSPVVLSQCGNYIIHRIHNRLDLDFVSAVLPYFSDDYVTKIKQAIPGEALIFGNCVPMPLRVQLQKAYPEPSSENCKVWEEWR